MHAEEKIYKNRGGPCAESCSYPLRMKLTPQTASVLHKAKEAINYLQLEQAVPFALLHQTINQLVNAHDRAAELAQARKSARRWTPDEDEQLRRGWRAGVSVGELSDQLARAPRSVEHQLVVLGLLNRSAIRKAGAPVHHPSQPPKPSLAEDEEEERPLYTTTGVESDEPDEQEQEWEEDNDEPGSDSDKPEEEEAA
jgi:hypothetical protein